MENEEERKKFEALHEKYIQACGKRDWPRPMVEEAFALDMHKVAFLKRCSSTNIQEIVKQGKSIVVEPISVNC